MNIGKLRLCCQDCEVTHYCAKRTSHCVKCERKRGKAEEKFKKRYEKVLLENPDYFKEAEEFADDLLKLSR